MLKINKYEKGITLLFILTLIIVGHEAYDNKNILDISYFVIVLIFFVKFLYIMHKK